jgi:hypothetical protein
MFGPQQISFGGDLLVFHLPRTLCFSLLSFNECSLFLVLRLSFIFHLDFYSDLVISLHQGVLGPLVYVGIHQKKFFQKGSNGVGEEKKFHAKKWYKKELV